MEGIEKYRYLGQKNIREQLPEMNAEQLSELCGEIRRFLLKNVSRTGGHLASNLGAVELTVALHRCFDSSRDRLIFDVGHQCYTHKLLTGRMDGFAELRKLGGMSGFLRPDESEHDPCITGHASNSVSVALGMAHARTLLKEDYHIVPILGDGALTGGMAYEALNSVGDSKEPLIIVLNDNNMSIDKNVGAMNHHLNKLRVRPKYLKMKQDMHEAFAKIPGGNNAADFISRSKKAVKGVILPNTLFEQMGIMYLGPVNGHDILSMCELLEMAKGVQKPVLIHVMTRKGMGYKPSEQHPEVYHGVSQFDLRLGVPLKQDKQTFSTVFGHEMIRLGLQDDKLCAVTAAMPTGTGLTPFAKQFPNRFFDIGIAEEHAVGMTAGMAKQGLHPVCAIYSTFLQRAYDQLIHDIALDRIPCVIAIDRAGIVGDDGPTHNGVFDVGFLRQIPGMRVLAPSSYAELRSMMSREIGKCTAPTAIRYPRGSEGTYRDDNSAPDGLFLKHGSDVTLVGYGIMINELLDAQRRLEERGISASVYKINDISAPFSDELTEDIKRTKRVLIAEDTVHNGSVGQALLAELENRDISPEWAYACNCGDRFAPQGTIAQVYRMFGLDGESIADLCTAHTGVLEEVDE